MATRQYTYRKSGVDINEADRSVSDISRIRKPTERQFKLCNPFGFFAAAVDLKKYRRPVLVTTCDGVGTKLSMLHKYNRLETAGWDLVAMNVNDIITTGADAVTFLDYIGVHKIIRGEINRLVRGMADACRVSGCVLAGGETAEMPALVNQGAIELAGFCAGVAEKTNLIDASAVKSGDAALGFRSSGFHANGYTLIQKIIKTHANQFSRKDLNDLLQPTRIYCRQVNKIREQGIRLHGIAHITGSGIPGNLCRVLPPGLGVRIMLPSPPKTMNKLLQYVEPAEAVDVFNMGLGLIIIARCRDVARLLRMFPELCTLGTIEKSRQPVDVVL